MLKRRYRLNVPIRYMLIVESTKAVRGEVASPGPCRTMNGPSTSLC